MMEELREAYSAALALELAIRGAIASEIVDSGPAGQSLADAAGDLADRLQAIIVANSTMECRGASRNERGAEAIVSRNYARGAYERRG